MKNKLALLLVALLINSCSSAKKDNTVHLSESEASGSKTSFSETEKSEQVAVVYFDYDSAKITKDAASTLKGKVVATAKSIKVKRIVIEAHCDERGTDKYNQKLSDRRAKAVKNYLVNNGIKSANIKTVGYGESKPVDLGHDEESWAKNRRAVTIIIKN